MHHFNLIFYHLSHVDPTRPVGRVNSRATLDTRVPARAHGIVCTELNYRLAAAGSQTISVISVSKTADRTRKLYFP